MFELIVKCSKEVKKIVIDFGDSTQSVMQMSDTESIESSFDYSSKPYAPSNNQKVEPQKDISDIIAERASAAASRSQPVKTGPPKESTLPKIDIANRPPVVDEDFQKGY